MESREGRWRLLQFAVEDRNVRLLARQGGETINSIRAETGASVHMENYVHNCEERVLKISTEEGCVQAFQCLVAFCF